MQDLELLSSLVLGDESWSMTSLKTTRPTTIWATWSCRRLLSSAYPAESSNWTSCVRVSAATGGRMRTAGAIGKETWPNITARVRIHKAQSLLWRLRARIRVADWYTVVDVVKM